MSELHQSRKNDVPPRLPTGYDYLPTKADLKRKHYRINPQSGVMVMESERPDAMTRRDLLKTGAGAALTGSIAVGDPAEAGAQTRTMNVYETLGVKPVINATGSVTILGGSVMPPEVVAAWVEASKQFVNIVDLHNKVGERIANLIGVEAALVTTGAAGAILLGTAAAVTHGDRELIRRLPASPGARSEVLLQKTHRSGYDSQMTDVGVKLVEVETLADLDRAISERTALMFFMNVADADGKIPRAAWIAAARKHRVPTLLDAAADVPPVERLSEYNKLGFDLVAISGGKAIRGPNDTGLLLGRKDLIEAAKQNANPYAPTIGRMMKVGKEDMVALLAAVERFVHLDHQAETRELERRLSVIEHALRDIPTLECERVVPPIANHFPHLILSWDASRIKLSREQMTAELAASAPPIQIGRVGGTGTRGVLISVLTLNEGEERIVAERLFAILKKAAGQT
jgi:D-glucosaminate-6-phosphate ammonia-lyase